MYFTHGVVCLYNGHSDLLQNNAPTWCSSLECDRSPNAIDYVPLLTLIKVEPVQEIKATHAHSNEIVSITLCSLTPSIITILQQKLNQFPPPSPLSLLLSLIFSSNWFNHVLSLQITNLLPFCPFSQSHHFLCPFTYPIHSFYPLSVFAFCRSGGCPRPGLFQGWLDYAVRYTNFSRWPYLHNLWTFCSHVCLSSHSNIFFS